MKFELTTKLVVSKTSMKNKSSRRLHGEFHKVLNDLGDKTLYPNVKTLDSSEFFDNDKLPDLFVLDVRDLLVRIGVASSARTKFSERIKYLFNVGYQLIDALGDKDSFTWYCSFTKLDLHKSKTPACSFVTNNRSFTLQFDTFENNMRNICSLGNNFYERYMLEDARSYYAGGSVVDVGANIGNHSIFFADMVDENNKVIAIEANPRSLKILEKNLIENNLIEKVRIVPNAAGSESGFCRVEDTSKNLGAAKVKKISNKENNSTDIVSIVTLDDVLKNEEKIDIIKIDVEGFEVEVLKGSIAILKKHKPVLYVEASTDEMKSAVDDVLKQLGYKSEEKFNDTPTWRYCP